MTKLLPTKDLYGRSVTMFDLGESKVLCISFDLWSDWSVLVIQDNGEMEWVRFAHLSPEIHNDLASIVDNPGVTTEIREAFLASTRQRNQS